MPYTVPYSLINQQQGVNVMKCTCGHQVNTAADSVHPPRPTQHPDVFLLSCAGCGTSLDLIMSGDDVLRKPTKNELRTAYGLPEKKD